MPDPLLRGLPVEEDSDELIAAVGEGSGFLEHDMDLGLGHSLDGFAGTHVNDELFEDLSLNPEVLDEQLSSCASPEDPDELLIVCAYYYVYLNHVSIMEKEVGKLNPQERGH